MRKRLMLCTAAVVIVGFVLAFSLAGFLVQNQYQNEFTRRWMPSLPCCVRKIKESREVPAVCESCRQSAPANGSGYPGDSAGSEWRYTRKISNNFSEFLCFVVEFHKEIENSVFRLPYFRASQSAWC